MKILVVEDEHKIASSIKRGLGQERMAVDLAFNGSDGLEMSLGEDYDLIILDRLLPEMDGLEICKALREKNIHTPILMLTAKGEVGDRVDGLNAGADDYLVKPFAFEELLARIKALGRRPSRSLGTTLEVSNLSLNTVTYEVKRAGKLIQLSAKEFALLEYLMRHKNQTLSKDQIISHVWDYDADILPNNIEVYIGYLRTKIDRSFKKKLIKTIRGFGYRLGGDDV